MSIDSNFPSKLNILDVQYEDAGLYKCEVTYEKGVRITSCVRKDKGCYCEDKCIKLKPQSIIGAHH